MKEKAIEKEFFECPKCKKMVDYLQGKVGAVQVCKECHANKR